MNDILFEFSHDVVCRALEQNLVEAVISWTRVEGCALYRDPDLLRYKTGIPYPLFNGAMMAALEQGSSTRRIEEVVAGFSAMRLPMVWWTGPSTRPSDLADMLIDHGFAHAADCVGMAARIGDLPSPPDLGRDVEVRLVESATDLKSWIQSYVFFFDFPPAIEAHLFRLLSGLGFHQPWCRYMAVKDGDVIATASLFFGAGVAGIYDVATAESYRGRGIGTAMTLEPLLCAGEQGFRIGVLGSTGIGYPVYRRIGFKDFCTLSFYEFMGSPSPDVQAGSEEPAETGRVGDREG